MNQVAPTLELILVSVALHGQEYCYFFWMGCYI